MARQSRWSRLSWIAWTAALAIMVVLPTRAQWADAPQQWRSLSAQAVEAYQPGDYSEGIALSEKALKIARQSFGDGDSRTLTSLYNLAVLQEAHNRCEEAEVLYREALQISCNVLGQRHLQTLICLNSLGKLYNSQGRYLEAEPLLHEALQTSRDVLGPRHPDTLTSLTNLAFLYHTLGRYGEAEPLFQEALEVNREVRGTRDPDTLISLNNMAFLYYAQGRYGEAEPLLREALNLNREVLGARHSDTLNSLHNLASLYTAQERYGEAEPLYLEALRASREVLGPRDPQTLASLNNLAFLYEAQGRYGEAEPLYRVALQTTRDTLGAHHPQTISSLYNLAFHYGVRDKYGEAEPLYREALHASRDVLGNRHPNTLAIELNMTALLVNLGRSDEALRMLQEMETHLLGWLGQELYSTEAGAARRLLVYSQAKFESFALTLAISQSSSEARRLAGTVMLRFKLLQGEEEAYLARLIRRSPDPRVGVLAEVGKLRSMLPGAVQDGTFDKTLQEMEAQQLALGEISRDYKDHLRVSSANLDDLRSVLPADAALVEFRQFQPVDFRTGKSGEPRLAALLVAGFDEPVVADLGPVLELIQPAGKLADAAAAALYLKLFGRFEDKLAAASTVYLAPDGFLHLVPFARLKLADGRYLGERQQLRLVQSGRDLLRPEPDKPARGLLALGGIDFDATADEGKPDGVVVALTEADRKSALTRFASTRLDGFSLLPASGDEAVQVKEWYQLGRKDEPADVWFGADASKARLMALKSPPRVLHLATHGFYLRSDLMREPMLLSGVALAGANRELEGKGADGILFALEAQRLNLDGSELVVLSACDTAQGGLDYSEGVYGLVRALRIAGARNVLVTLWPLNDGEAREFMVKFYKTWLSQTRSDPAKALRDIQLSYLKDDKLHNPHIWAPYIVIE